MCTTMGCMAREWAVPSSRQARIAHTRAAGAQADLRHVSVSEHPTT